MLSFDVINEIKNSERQNIEITFKKITNFQKLNQLNLKFVLVTLSIATILIGVLMTGSYSKILLEEANAELQSIEFDEEQYTPGETVFITLVGSNITLDTDLVDQVSVNVFSSSDISGIDVLLTETGTDTEIFVGEIMVTATDESSGHRLRVSLGDVITVTANEMSDTANILSTTLDTIKFAVIGDYGDDSAQEQAVSNLVKNWDPDFIITVGDNNYPSGSADTIDDNVGKYYHEFIGNYQGDYADGSSINKFFPTLGNHDWRGPISNGDASPHLDYFTLPGNERYYNFVKGPVHFFAYDSDQREPDGIGVDSIQADWLHNGLTNSESIWNIVFFHHSPYSSGLHGQDSNLIPLQEIPYGEWGVDVVLGGHDHDYERLLVSDDSGLIPYFVNGISGSDIRQFSSSILAESQFRYNNQPGAMLIEANNGCISFKFINILNDVIDSYFIGSCLTMVFSGLPVFSCVANHRFCDFLDLVELVKIKPNFPAPLCKVIDCDPICLSCPELIITKDTLIDIQQQFPPLKQYNAGIHAKEITPSKENVLVTTDERIIPASVTPQTAQELVKHRGWQY